MPLQSGAEGFRISAPAWYAPDGCGWGLWPSPGAEPLRTALRQPPYSQASAESAKVGSLLSQSQSQQRRGISDSDAKTCETMADISDLPSAAASVPLGDHLFCHGCGGILPGVSNREDCRVCGMMNDTSGTATVTRSKPKAKLLSFGDDAEVWQSVDETCPKCAHPELSYKTAQLRSVDEGATIFYKCPKCGFTYSVNN